jgi:hypothetical protein
MPMSKKSEKIINAIDKTLKVNINTSLNLSGIQSCAGIGSIKDNHIAMSKITQRDMADVTHMISMQMLQYGGSTRERLQAKLKQRI